MATPTSANHTSNLAESVVPPTRVRFQVLLMLGAMTFILYLDRVCIGQAAPLIQAELGISTTGMGFIFGAFTLAYGIFEIPTGQLADRYGTRRVLTRIVIWWSIFTMLTGTAYGFWMLMVIRFLFGAGEAGALPNSARVVSRWFPADKRGIAQGWVATAMMVGGAVSPITAALLIEAVGWRWCFVIFGCIGLIWAWYFFRWFRDEPAEHPSVNAQERALIGTTPHGDSSLSQATPWAEILSHRTVWLMGGLMCCGAAVFYMIISWYPKYLQSARQVSNVTSGALASLVLAGGALGSIVGGSLTDMLMRRTGSDRISRVRVGMVSFGVGTVVILLSVQMESAVASAAFMAAGFFCVQLQIPAWWATVIGIAGRHVGTLGGMCNSLGVIGGILSQLFLGSLADILAVRGYIGRDQWDPGFYIYASVMLAGVILWFFVRPEQRLQTEQRTREG